MSLNRRLFSDTLKKIEPIYKYAGLNLYDKKDKWLRRAIFVFNFLCLNMDTSCSINAFISAEGQEFTDLSYLAPCIIYTYLANIKIYFFVVHENTVHELVKLLKKLEDGYNENVMKDQKSIDSDRIFLDRTIKICDVMCYMLLLIFSVAPLIATALKYYELGTVNLLLPFPVLYPFDPFNLKIYPIVYIHQIWSNVVVILFVRAKDYFLYTCCTYIKVQFNLLQKEFEDLLSPSDNVENSDNVIPLSEFYSKFKDLVTRHQELIRSVTMLEVIFTKSMLYNIGASSLMICLSLFNVTIIKDNVLVMPFFIFLGLTYLQIYFLCSFGHSISQSSIEVSDRIYNSQWYLTDALVGKHLLLVMMRSQKRCKLTAYGFVDIDLKVFMRILSNAWSYFALLKTIYP